MRNKWWLFFSCVLFTLGAGCSFETDGTARSATVPTSAVASKTAAATKEPTTTSTGTPTATPTRMPIPTVDIDAATVRMNDFLKGNNGCGLPCFWGLTPGKSGFMDGYQLLFPLSELSNFTYLEDSPGAMDPMIPLADYYLKVSIRYLEDQTNHLIKSIGVDIRPWERFPDPMFEGGYGYSPVYDLPEFGEAAAFYMLPGVLSRLGPPESAYILTMGKSGVEGMGYWDFDLVLLYPDQGILIDYNTKKRIAGDFVLGCMANAMVELNLTPIVNRDAFFADLVKTKWENVEENYIPLEELTSLSVEEFYRIYNKPTDKCLTIPIDKLPVWYP